MSRYKGLADSEWQEIERYMPKENDKSYGFQRKVSNRQIVEAILYRYRTGIPWRDLPEQFGKWNTIYVAYMRWCKAGVIDNLLKIINKLRGVDISQLSIDSSVVRVHKHGTGARKRRGDQKIGRSKGG